VLDLSAARSSAIFDATGAMSQKQLISPEKPSSELLTRWRMFPVS
jgi:hypothetical protein